MGDKEDINVKDYHSNVHTNHTTSYSASKNSNICNDTDIAYSGKST